MMDNISIKVNIWGELVGALSWDNVNGIGYFEYDLSFLNKGVQLAPILMPNISNQIYSFENLNAETFQGIPPMLVDSLPDTFGNQLFNTWLIKKGMSLFDLNPVQRLSYLGKRGMGALEYEPVLGDSSNRLQTIDFQEIVDIANVVLNSKEKNSYSNINENSLTDIISIGTSAGGMRAKIILAFDEKNNIYKPGDLVYEKNHSYWLLKLDGVSNKNLGDPEGFGKIEYAYYRMALECGIDMSKSYLHQENERYHFVTKRFDRLSDGSKLHMQTLSGLTGMDYKQSTQYSYEQVFNVLRKLQLPYSDFEKMFTRMIFNVVARNQDDHVKNISFLMNKIGVWSLSPAYDLSYSYNSKGIWTSQHQLSINGKRNQFELDDLLSVAITNNIKNPKKIIDKVIFNVMRFPLFAQIADVPKSQIDSIVKTHRLKLNKPKKKGLSM